MQLSERYRESEGEAYLCVNIRKGCDAEELSHMFAAQQKQSAMLTADEISREDYDHWRYHYPEFDISGQ